MIPTAVRNNSCKPGDVVWVQLGARYLQSVVVNERTDAGKTVLALKKSEDQVLVFLPTKANGKNCTPKTAFLWYYPEQIFSSVADLPSRNLVRVRPNTNLSPERWWIQYLGDSVTDLADRLPMVAVLEQNVKLWESHTRDIKNAKTYVDIGKEVAWMLKQVRCEVYQDKWKEWASSSREDSLARLLCPGAQHTLAKLEEAIAWVDERINWDFVTKLWGKEEFDWLKYNAQFGPMIPTPPPVQSTSTPSAQPTTRPASSNATNNSTSSIPPPGVKKDSGPQLGGRKRSLSEINKPTNNAANTTTAAPPPQQPAKIPKSGSKTTSNKFTSASEATRSTVAADVISEEEVMSMARQHLTQLVTQSTRKSVPGEAMLDEQGSLPLLGRRVLQAMKRILSQARGELHQDLRRKTGQLWKASGERQGLLECQLCHFPVVPPHVSRPHPPEVLGRCKQLGDPIAVCCGRSTLKCQCLTPTSRAAGVVHRLCALYSPQVVEIQDPANDTTTLVQLVAHVRGPPKQYPFTAEVSRGKKLTCKVCGLRGATLGCYAPHCKSSFHYPCAAEGACHFVPDSFVMACHMHLNWCRTHVGIFKEVETPGSPQPRGGGGSAEVESPVSLRRVQPLEKVLASSNNHLQAPPPMFENAFPKNTPPTVCPSGDVASSTAAKSPPEDLDKAGKGSDAGGKVVDGSDGQGSTSCPCCFQPIRSGRSRCPKCQAWKCKRCLTWSVCDVRCQECGELSVTVEFADSTQPRKRGREPPPPAEIQKATPPLPDPEPDAAAVRGKKYCVRCAELIPAASKSCPKCKKEFLPRISGAATSHPVEKSDSVSKASKESNNLSKASKGSDGLNKASQGSDDRGASKNKRCGAGCTRYIDATKTVCDYCTFMPSRSSKLTPQQIAQDVATFPKQATPSGLQPGVDMEPSAEATSDPSDQSDDFDNAIERCDGQKRVSANGSDRQGIKSADAGESNSGIRLETRCECCLHLIQEEDRSADLHEICHKCLAWKCTGCLMWGSESACQTCGNVPSSFQEERLKTSLLSASLNETADELLIEDPDSDLAEGSEDHIDDREFFNPVDYEDLVEDSEDPLMGDRDFDPAEVSEDPTDDDEDFNPVVPKRKIPQAKPRRREVIEVDRCSFPSGHADVSPVSADVAPPPELERTSYPIMIIDSEKLITRCQRCELRTLFIRGNCNQCKTSLERGPDGEFVNFIRSAADVTTHTPQDETAEQKSDEPESPNETAAVQGMFGDDDAMEATEDMPRSSSSVDLNFSPPQLNTLGVPKAQPDEETFVASGENAETEVNKEELEHLRRALETTVTRSSEPATVMTDKVKSVLFEGLPVASKKLRKQAPPPPGPPLDMSRLHPGSQRKVTARKSLSAAVDMTQTGFTQASTTRPSPHIPLSFSSPESSATILAPSAEFQNAKQKQKQKQVSPAAVPSSSAAITWSDTVREGRLCKVWVLSSDMSGGVEAVPVRCVLDVKGAQGGEDGEPVAVTSELAASLPRPEPFKYLRSSIGLDRLGLHHRAQEAQIGCNCTSGCGLTAGEEVCIHAEMFSEDDPSCVGTDGLPMHGRIAYNSRGEVIVPNQAGGIIYECNASCKCPPSCPNRVLQRGMTVSVEVFRTANGRGWGVRARQPITRGTFVVEYVGEIIDNDEATRRGEDYDDRGCSYLYDLDHHLDSHHDHDHMNSSEYTKLYVIDANAHGNASRFINHSCEPNLAVYSVIVDAMDVNLARIGLYATRDVAAGEEITYNYNYKLLKDKQMACHCGAPNCRKRLY